MAYRDLIDAILKRRMPHPNDITDAEIAAGLKDRDIDPRYEPGVVDRYGENRQPGTTDMTAAAQKAADVISIAGGEIGFVRGVYKITDQISLTGSNVTLRIEAGAIVDASDTDLGSSSSVFVFGETTEVATTTVSTAIAVGDRDINVASSASFAAGDLVAIVSSDEYWGGITGVSGFGRKTKGELTRVRSVSAGVITLEMPARDSYSITSLTVTAIKLAEIDNITVKLDGKLIGPGGGTDHTSANPTGFRGITARCVRSFKIHGAGTISNFPRFGVVPTLCSSVEIIGGIYEGRDLSDPTNLPTVSPWFTAIHISACNGVQIRGVTGRYARRLYDADSVTLSAGMVIGRTHVVSLHAEACQEVCGGHAVQDVTYLACTGNGCVNGGSFRGRDVKMINCDFGAVATSVIDLGGATSIAYSTTESPSLGNVVLLGNRGTGGRHGIVMTDDVDSLISDNNYIKCCTIDGDTGYYMRSRRVRNISIGPGDVIDLSDRATDAIGVLISNVSSARLVIENVAIKAKIVNPYVGVSISGTGDQTTPANNIDIDCLIIDAEQALVDFTASAVSSDEIGFFGEDVSAKVRYLGSEPTLLLDIPTSTTVNRYTRRVSFECNRVRRPIGYGRPSTDIHTGETVSAGDILVDSDTHAEFYCLTSGTAGDDGGAEVSITSGQTSGTVAGGTIIAPGQYVRIAGAGPASGNLDTRVTFKSGTAITLADAAGTTVSGAALSFINPTWRATDVEDATAANIASAAASVNTADKYTGKLVRDTTNNRLMMARGTTSTSQWDVVDGSASVTPS